MVAMVRHLKAMILGFAFATSLAVGSAIVINHGNAASPQAPSSTKLVAAATTTQKAEATRSFSQQGTMCGTDPHISSAATEFTLTGEREYSVAWGARFLSVTLTLEVERPGHIRWNSFNNNAWVVVTSRRGVVVAETPGQRDTGRTYDLTAGTPQPIAAKIPLMKCSPDGDPHPAIDPLLQPGSYTVWADVTGSSAADPDRPTTVRGGPWKLTIQRPGGTSR